MSDKPMSFPVYIPPSERGREQEIARLRAEVEHLRAHIAEQNEHWRSAALVLRERDDLRAEVERLTKRVEALEKAREQEPQPAYLECNHCGDVAVESATGMFGEDMADRCQSCGFPGSVDVDESEDEPTASWSCSQDEDARCTRPACSECWPEPKGERCAKCHDLGYLVHPHKGDEMPCSCQRCKCGHDREDHDPATGRCRELNNDETKQCRCRGWSRGRAGEGK